MAWRLVEAVGSADCGSCEPRELIIGHRGALPWHRLLGSTAEHAQTRHGNAAQEIIAAASDARADFIVIGSRGRTGLERLLLGSVARNVLFHAPCSVLVVRQRVNSKA